MSARPVDLFGEVSRADTGVRDLFDFYETPAFQTRSLLQFAPDICRSTVLEVASGRDAIASVLRHEAACKVFTNDIDPQHPAMTHFDATNPTYWREQAPAVDWVISNLPFNVAFEIVIQAYKHARLGVAFLLRKTWLEPTVEDRSGPPRGPWLGSHCPTRQIHQPRVSYRGDGSDSCACDWMIWDKDGVTRRSFVDYLAKTRTQRFRLEEVRPYAE